MWETLTEIFPENVNRPQVFDFNDEGRTLDEMRLVFEESSDFFGRITIYHFNIQGDLEQSGDELLHSGINAIE